MMRPYIERLDLDSAISYYNKIASAEYQRRTKMHNYGKNFNWAQPYKELDISDLEYRTRDEIFWMALHSAWGALAEERWEEQEREEVKRGEWALCDEEMGEGK